MYPRSIVTLLNRLPENSLKNVSYNFVDQNNPSKRIPCLVKVSPQNLWFKIFRVNSWKNPPWLNRLRFDWNWRYDLIFALDHTRNQTLLKCEFI